MKTKNRDNERYTIFGIIDEKMADCTIILGIFGQNGQNLELQ